MKDMIESILLVDDEDLFHLVFEDACSLLDITLTLESINSADDAEKLFKTKYRELDSRPACVFVDLNIIGSSFDSSVLPTAVLKGILSIGVIILFCDCGANGCCCCIYTIII